MDIVLKELTISDDMDIYDMLQEIGPGENGFVNEGFGEVHIYPDFLQKYADFSKGINVPFDQVAQTMYWLYVNQKPIGYGKLRHYLNDRLRKIGGHIGYAVRPSEWNKGYGTIILAEMLKKAQGKGFTEVLMTCLEHNVGSRKVIEKNKGILQNIIESECYYIIKI